MMKWGRYRRENKFYEHEILQRTKGKDTADASMIRSHKFIKWKRKAMLITTSNIHVSFNVAKCNMTSGIPQSCWQYNCFTGPWPISWVFQLCDKWHRKKLTKWKCNGNNQIKDFFFFFNWYSMMWNVKWNTTNLPKIQQ